MISDAPLKAHLRNGKLIISIGLNTLAWALDSENGGPFEQFCVGSSEKDKTTFGKDIIREMTKENEVGETPLMGFLDSMGMEALDSGSGAVYEKVGELPA